MRVPRFRFTVARMMVMVLAVAILWHLALTAYRVSRVRDQHIHIAVVVCRDGSVGGYADLGARSPFWPRYWRGVVGMPWKGRGLCVKKKRQPVFKLVLAELCELENPEICRRPNAFTVSWGNTTNQAALERQIRDRYNARERAKAPPVID